MVLRMPAVDDYLDGLDVSTRAALKYKQKPLIAFLAAKHHLSIFPCSSRTRSCVTLSGSVWKRSFNTDR